MRILVVGGFEALSPYAHAINTVKMAQGFAELGHEVTLVCWRPANRQVQENELSEAYGVVESVKWILLPHCRLWSSPECKPWVMGAIVAALALTRRSQFVFCRDYIVPWITSRLGLLTVAESHAHPGNNTPHFRRLIQATHYPAFKLWVTISPRLVKHYVERGVPPEKLIVLPDAVDLARFRRPAELPPSPYQKPGPHVAYVGHLYDYKGIPTILAAAAILPDIRFHLIGGFPENIERQKQRIREMGLMNVTLHGLKSHVEVPPYLWHADVLLLPPSQHHPSAEWTSPLKLGEYLASGTPVVATSIPALRDWLSNEEVRFVPPDDAEAMAVAIRYLLDHHTWAQNLSQAGQRKASLFSYKNRAAVVLERLVGNPV